MECMPVSPRLLLVVVGVKNITLIIVVAHAPINGDDAAGDFFSDLSARIGMLKSRFPDAPVAVLADFNARVGSVTSDNIGGYHAEEENSNGDHLRALLLEHGLAALNTLREEGAGFTWTGSLGHRSRIDYVAWPLDRLQNVQHVRVNRAIELTDAERDDHNVVDFEVIVKQVEETKQLSATEMKAWRVCVYASIS